MAKKFFFLNICLPALLAACLLSACGNDLPETPVQTLPVSTEETAASTAESESESVIVTTPEASTQETQPSLQPSEKETEAPSSSAETTPETTETVDPETAKKEATEASDSAGHSENNAENATSLPGNLWLQTVSTTSTSLTVRNLTAGKNYYVRIRAYRKVLRVRRRIGSWRVSETSRRQRT